MPKMKISFLGTGSGTSTNSAHTAIVYDCDDGTRLLIDTSSGNSVARNCSALGIPPESFDTVGHTHRAISKEFGTRKRFLNPGAWFEEGAHAEVTVDGVKLLNYNTLDGVT